MIYNYIYKPNNNCTKLKKTIPAELGRHPMQVCKYALLYNWQVRKISE